MYDRREKLFWQGKTQVGAVFTSEEWGWDSDRVLTLFIIYTLLFRVFKLRSKKNKIWKQKTKET